MKSDSNASLAYLLENYDIDEEKLGILGYSMGGRLALEIVSEEGTPIRPWSSCPPPRTPGEESLRAYCRGDFHRGCHRFCRGEGLL